MAEPERKPIQLQPRMLGSVALDRFEIANEMKKEGPWLIIPSQNVDVDFRPTFYPTNIDVLMSDISSIQTAIKVYHPVTAPSVITDFLYRMASDIEHPSWGYFRNLWDNFGYLPLSTFEAWKALVKTPSVLTIALFKFEMNEEFVRRIDAEFPILWELISLEHWVFAKNCFSEWLLKLGANEKLINGQITKMFDRFSRVIPSFPTPIIEHFKGQDLAPRLLPTQEKMLINSLWLQDLIREHSESDWPISLKYEIEKAADELGDIRDLIDFPHFRQSSVVLYPVLAAAFAIGKLQFVDIFRNDSNTIH
ncbi:STY4851/ECs_5259 family protein, partial [Paraglaciecola mesophila]|uniref:STY4851/ECs_5259 family protein n=1 Tax=Paraglaciecola mesophila TaxID=197222 RepID=UPI0005869F45